jgi:hypothetical protein
MMWFFRHTRTRMIWAAALAIRRAVRLTEQAADKPDRIRVRATLRLGGPMHWFRTKTYIISVRKIKG